MSLENWLYRRDREEYILSVFCSESIDFVRHLVRQHEAEQEIERMLRA